MVVIVIVNYNGFTDTLKCVETLLQSTYKEFYILVIDNNSTDGSINKMQNGLESLKVDFDVTDNVFMGQMCHKVVIIKSLFNGGFAYANNIGIKYTQNNIDSYKYIWFLNNDTLVQDNTLQALVEYMKCAEGHIGLLGAKLMFMDNPQIIQGIGGKYNKFWARCSHIGAYEEDRGQYNNCTILMDYIIGASMFVRKEFVDSVGLMCEDYFLYFEELDWINRGKCGEWKFAFCHDAIVLHKEGGSTKVNNNMISEIADVCQIKNRLLFTYKYYPFYLFSVLPACLLTILSRLIKGEPRRASILMKNVISTLRKILNEK